MFGGDGQSVVSRKLAAVQSNKAYVNVWDWNRDTPQVRCSAPEKLVSVAVSEVLQVLVGGGESGKAYMWEIGTGSLLRSWDCHYRPVRALSFTDDGLFLITGGDDAIVNVYEVRQLMDEGVEYIKAHVSWAQHSLSITCIVCGYGGSSGRIITASKDQTIRIWDLTSKRSLVTVSYPKPISTITLNHLETWLYVGTFDGEIYATPLHAASANVVAETSLITMEAHQGRITALVVSDQGTQLFSTSLDGTLKFWDTTTHQMVRSVTFSSPLTALVATRPPETSGKSGKRREARRVDTLEPFKKYKRAEGETNGMIRVRTTGLPREETEIQRRLVSLAGKCKEDKHEKEDKEKEELRDRVYELEQENATWLQVAKKMYGIAASHTFGPQRPH